MHSRDQKTSIMLNRLKIKGFKSLTDIDIELGRVNVLVGANGSGKTNLLESLGLLKVGLNIHNNQILDSEWYSNSQALLRSGIRPAVPRMYFSGFPETEKAEKIHIEATSGTAMRVTFQLTSTESFNPSMTFEPNEKKTNDLFFLYSDYSIFSPVTPVLRGTMPDISQRRPIGIAGGRLAEAVEELLDVEAGRFGDLPLEDLLELLDWVDEIAVVPPSRDLIDVNVPTSRSIIRFTDRWMQEGRNQFSAHDASEGALYVLFSLVLAMHPQSPGLFAIDNFDQAMHPRLARAATRVFCDQLLESSPPRQALLTTHNPLVLDGLDLRDDRIRLFAVERNHRGASQVHRVEVSEEILQSTQDGLSLSNLWVMGRLGGVPDLF